MTDSAMLSICREEEGGDREGKLGERREEVTAELVSCEMRCWNKMTWVVEASWKQEGNGLIDERATGGKNSLSMRPPVFNDPYCPYSDF